MQERLTQNNLPRISVLGCGWFGLPLATAFANAGYQVNGSVTTAAKLPLLAVAGITPYLLYLSPDAAVDNTAFFDCEVLFVAFPPGIKNEGDAVYLQKISQLIALLQHHPVQQVVFISSTAVYGEVNDVVTELTPPQPATASGRALLKAEAMLQQQPGYTTTILRFGGLVGPGRDPGRFFAGKTAIPNGRAPVNLIHLADCTGISMAIVEQQQYGVVYNACSPDHLSRAAFYTHAATRAGLPVPAFADELLGWKIVSSVQVAPLLHYTFDVPDWKVWLNHPD